MTFHNVMPYLLSVLAIYTTFQAGNMRAHAWLVGAASQAMWIWWAVDAQTFGFIPLSVVLTYLYSRNFALWISGHER